MGLGCTREAKSNYHSQNKNNFMMVRSVGKGGFGRVWRVVERRTKQTWALKIIDKARVIKKKSINSVMNERDILVRLSSDPSPFLVNMMCSFQDRECLYLVMDYLQAGDLRYYLNHRYVFRQEQTSSKCLNIEFIARCLMEGLRYLHHRNIIHRDVKPQNIIVDKSGYCRLTDLGIAREWKTENSQETSGTPGYMSPEVLLRQNHSFCADYYAVGVICYELLIGKRPYDGKDRKKLREQILSKEASLPLQAQQALSVEAVDFVHRLLTRTPRKRLGYEGINQIINHPWLKYSQEEQRTFYQRKQASPIIPLEIIPGEAMNEDTEPDQVWRESILLLKKQEIQMLFQNYQYDPKSIQTNKKNSLISTTV